MTTDANNIEISEKIFLNTYTNEYMLPQGSVIYVLSEEMKTKVEAACDLTKTTVQVVTAEQMKNL